MTPFCQDRIDRYKNGDPSIRIERQDIYPEAKNGYHWVLFEEGSDKIVYGIGTFYGQRRDDFDYAWVDNVTEAHMYYDEGNSDGT